MTIKTFYNLIDEGREIEFQFNNKMYSITYGIIDGKEVMSFCEFYKESVEVTTVEELLRIKIENTTVYRIITSLTDEDIWIF